MGKESVIYIKAKQHIQINKQDVYMKDVAQVVTADTDLQNKVKCIKLCHFSKDKKDRCVIDTMDLLKKIEELQPGAQIESIGATETIIQFEKEAKHERVWNVLKICFVSFVCFFGAGFTIMAFHNDINIRGVLQQLYYLLQGTESDGFTILEISYSIGLGTGIILFFNHIGKRRITKDPTPIEVEMQVYEEEIEQTLIQNAERIKEKQ